MKIKKLLIPLLSSVLALGTITPVVACTIVSHDNVVNQPNNVQYTFNDQTFNNKSQLFSYARSIAQENKYTTIDRNKWSIEYNGQTKYFSNINDLFDFLSDKIITHKGSSSYPLVVDADGGIDKSSVWNDNLDIDNPSTTTIYKGNNDTYFTSEQEAKDSYLEIHEAYLFNGIYFRTKQELKSYLTTNYDLVKDNSDKTIVVVSPSNNSSQPINLEKLKAKDQYELNKFSSFVSLYANKYLEVESNNNSTNQKEYTYYDANDIKNITSDALSRWDNPSYIPINSNQGNGNYLIDLNQSDEADLYGPYYTKGTASLESITNPDCWTRLEGTSWNFNDNQKIAQLLSSFMDMLIYEGEDNGMYPFNITDISSQTNEYFTYLKTNYPYVYDSVMDLYNTMKTGKRYSTFYKLPILYIKTLEELMYVSAKQEAVQKTIDYFKTVAKSYDKRLYAIVPSIFLEPKVEGTYHKLSFVDLFKIGDKTFDLNSDIEAFADIINQEYPNFVEFMNYISAPMYYGLYMPDILKYNQSLVTKINSEYKFNFAKFNNNFKEIWDAYTTSNIDTLESFITNTYTENTNEQLDEETQAYLVSQFGFMKDAFEKNTAKYIQDSINQANKNNILYSGFFGGLNSYLVKTFIKLYEFNHNRIDYRTFSLLKICCKLNPNFTFNPFTYSQNIIDRLLNIVTDYIVRLSIDALNTILAAWVGMNFIVNICYQGLNSLITSQWKHILTLTNKFSNSISTVLTASQKILKGLGKTDEAVENILKPFKKVFKAVPYLQIAMVAIDAFYPKTNKFSYVFETEGNKYIWNGGEELEWLFGLVTIPISDNKDMKMNKPIQVTKQHLVNGYYYNGKIYDDLNALKRQQLDDILNNRFNYDESGIKTVYSFNDLDDSIYVGRPHSGNNELVYDNIGTLTDESNKDLMDYVYQSVNDDARSPYANDNIYSFAGGYTFDPNLAMEKNIEQLTDEIKPVKIAMIPYLNNEHMPIEQDAIPEYKLPGQSWTSMGGLNQNTLDGYVILDTNVKDDDKANIQNINDLFYNQFDVENKTILINDLYRFNQYSSYNNNINNFYLYEVRLQNGYRKYFNNKSQALKWFMQQCNFKVYNIYNDIYEYHYGDLTFDSLDSYLSWVLANSEVKYE